METPVLLCAAIVLLVLLAAPIEDIAERFKRSQSWEEKNGHDRAARREEEWYWQTDSEKSRELHADGRPHKY